MRWSGWSLFAAATLAAGVARAAPAAGDWCGDLTPKAGVVLPLTLRLAHAPGDAWSGVLDSPAQSAAGFALSGVAVGGQSLTFDVPSIHGHFAGQWDQAGGAWAGQWTQGGGPLPLRFTPARVSERPDEQPLLGDWDGSLDAGAGMKLRLAVHLRSGPCGVAGGMDSIDQSAMGLPLAAIGREGAQVRFAVPVVGGSFSGTLDPAADTIEGTWRQGAGAMPLRLARRAPGKADATLDRPQTPKPPFPYRTEEVTFYDAAGHVRLAGVLSLPQGKGPFPAVALIAGSGPQRRDEDVFGHKIFLVLADALTRHGIAVLRYDKRGLGASTGVFAKATVQDFALDAQAAVDFLARDPDIDRRHIGLVGHSEGGLIAPMVAARDPEVAFLVLMAGPGVDGAAVLAAQQRRIGEAMGVSSARLDQAAADQARLIRIVLMQPRDGASAALKAAADEMARTEGLPAGTMEAQAEQLDTDWFRSFLAYDPAPTLRGLRIPVLALVGSKDLQVPAEQNIPALRAALAQDSNATVDELPGLNHLFQPAITGAPSEYQTITTTMAPAALATITAWIRATAGLSG